MKRLNMTMISIIVSTILFTILASVIVIIVNYNNSTMTLIPDDSVLRVGLVLNGSADDRSWCQSHYDSLVRVTSELESELVFRENVPEDETSSAVIDELINDENCDIIIAASFGYGRYVLEAAGKYPEVYFYHATGNVSGRNLCSYTGRMYQLRYLSGILAGLQTKNGRIGYTAAFPIAEVNRGINAFALGVHSVNPTAEVYVSFTDSWTDHEAAAQSTEKLITGYGADVIAMHTAALDPLDTADKHGVWSIGYSFDNSDRYPDTYLTGCVWDWDVLYREQLRNCIQGSFHGETKWLGYDSGIMKLTDPAVTGNAFPGYEEALSSAEQAFLEHSFDVFYGPVTDNTGTVRVAADESMPDAVLLSDLDWYAEGVHIV